MATRTQVRTAELLPSLALCPIAILLPPGPAHPVQYEIVNVVRHRHNSPSHPQNGLGEKGRRIRELTSVVQKRFNFPEGSVELYAEKVATRGLCAIAQAESLRYKLIGGLAVRR